MTNEELIQAFPECEKIKRDNAVRIGGYQTERYI